MGCCSLLESDNDLQILNDLGPKFKTLAEICSLQKPSQTKIEGVVKTTVDIVEPLVKPKSEHIVETTIKTEKVRPSTNISKLSVSTVSTAPPSMTLPHSKVTDISHSASLSRPVQSVVLKQPVYYATSPVPQPVHYIVQSQLQNTVLLADGAHGPNFPCLYVVSGSHTPSGLLISGPQGSPSGIVIQGIESPNTPSQPSSPTTSPVSPTVILPGSPGLSQGSIPVDGWNIIGQNPDGNYIAIKKKNSAVEAEVMDPGSSQGTLPRGAILVKKAAPPQGVLGLAAHRNVYGVAKKGGVDGDTLPAGTSTVGISEISLNQFQGISTSDTKGIPVRCRLDSPKSINITIGNTTITTETTKNSHPSKKEALMENMFKSNHDPGQCPVIKNREIEGEQLDFLVTFTSEQEITLDDPNKVVEGTFEENECVQAKENSPIINIVDIIVKTLAEQSDSVVEKLGGRVDEIVDDQLTNIIGAPINTFAVMSLTAEFSDPQQNAEGQNHVPSKGSYEENKIMVPQISTTEAFVPGSHVICLINTDNEKEEFER